MNYLYNETLTHTEILISDLIKNNLEQVCSMSITELAIFTNVSPSKITKYSKRLGFSGYKEFIHQINLDFNNKSNNNNSFEFQKERVLKFLDSYNDDDLLELTSSIKTSNKIYLFGQGPSYDVAKTFTPRLRIATSKNIVCDYTELLYDLDNTINSKRLIILLTVSGKSNKVHEVLKLAKQKGIKTITISAYINKPLKEESDYAINLLNSREVFDVSLIHGRTLFYIYLEILLQELEDLKNKSH